MPSNPDLTPTQASALWAWEHCTICGQRRDEAPGHPGCKGHAAYEAKRCPDAPAGGSTCDIGTCARCDAEAAL